MTRVLFPEPETPVTHVNTPRGKSTSMSFRLFSEALRILMKSLGFLLFFGISIFSFPDRYLPVREHCWLIIWSTLPTATIFPPCSPAPGPMSTIKSLFLIVSSSCSTTTTVLPESRIDLSVSSSLSLSLGWRPIEGSSRT